MNTKENSTPVLVVEVVEDEMSLRGALKEKLQKEGFEVVEASDGEEGLKLAIEKQPDCILLDILMPKMDGMTMLNRLRSIKEGKNIPVFVLTNVNSTVMDNRDFEYLIKSDWKIEDIVEKIKAKLLKLNEAPQA